MCTSDRCEQLISMNILINMFVENKWMRGSLLKHFVKASMRHVWSISIWTFFHKPPSIPEHQLRKLSVYKMLTSIFWGDNSSSCNLGMVSTLYVPEIQLGYGDHVSRVAQRQPPSIISSAKRFLNDRLQGFMEQNVRRDLRRWRRERSQFLSPGDQ